MSDLSWCTHCDNAISHFSESLYCSEQCLRADALRNHPLLGYTYPEFVDFPKPYPRQSNSDAIMSTGLPSATLPTRNSSDSIRTLPTLSTSHSSCQSSPALSACDSTSTSTTTTAATPPLIHLPPAISMEKSPNTKSSPTPTSSSNCIPSFLLMGASSATTALSRPFIVDYRPVH